MPDKPAFGTVAYFKATDFPAVARETAVDALEHAANNCISAITKADAAILRDQAALIRDKGGLDA